MDEPKPDTVLFNKVTIKGAKQAVQMFGPAQAAVARAVVDSVAPGGISLTFYGWVDQRASDINKVRSEALRLGRDGLTRTPQRNGDGRST